MSSKLWQSNVEEKILWYSCSCRFGFMCAGVWVCSYHGFFFFFFFFFLFFFWVWVCSYYGFFFWVWVCSCHEFSFFLWVLLILLLGSSYFIRFIELESSTWIIYPHQLGRLEFLHWTRALKARDASLLNASKTCQLMK